jgi:hypothetical protein
MTKAIHKDHVIAATLIAGLLLLVLTAFLVHRSQRDSEGEANANCQRFPLAPVVGPSGWVISGHLTGCSPPAASVGGYVYVHPRGAKESIEYLAFRYLENSGSGDVTYRWIDERTIAVSLRSASEVTRMQKSIGPIRVVYEIGKMESRD